MTWRREYDPISGGFRNKARRVGSTVGGGIRNKAVGARATVSGGQQNTASGKWATVGGGLLNTAAGDYSFAAGRRAQALNDGSFVWGGSTDADFTSTANDQFLIRAPGGVGIGTTAPTRALDVAGDAIVQNFELHGLLYANSIHNRGVNNLRFDIDPPGQNAGASFLFNGGNVGIGTTEPGSTLDVAGRVTAAQGFSGGYRAGEFAALFQDFANNTIVWNQQDGGGAVWLIPEPQQGLIIAQDLATLDAGTGAHWIGIDGSDGSIYLNERGLDADVRIFRPETSTLAFSTGDVEHVRIDSAGNVGIGTASPDFTDWTAGGGLHILRDAPVIRLESTSTAALDLGVGSANGDFWLWDPVAKATRMRIENTTGNVGIGEFSFTEPQSTLQVSGYMQLDLTGSHPQPTAMMPQNTDA